MVINFRNKDALHSIALCKFLFYWLLFSYEHQCRLQLSAPHSEEQ